MPNRYDNPEVRHAVATRLREMADRIEDNSFGALSISALGDVFGNELWEILLDRVPTRRDLVTAAVSGAVVSALLHDGVSIGNKKHRATVLAGTKAFIDDILEASI